MSAAPSAGLQADAAQWRELCALLREKAYKCMTPTEIAAELPDLRAIYQVLYRQPQQKARRTGGSPH